MSGGWFFTAPETVIARRRGDPLGLRNITDEVAELVVPGLTNRTMDARWLSILCWALVQSHKAWSKNGGHNLRTADERRRRYEWLRPLELLWVKRSIIVGGNAFSALQWPGHDSVARWKDKTADFGMTPQQLRNHRQLGPYGAYRVCLRTPGFTKNRDGWTPDYKAEQLHRFVNEALGSAKPTWKNRPRSDPASWWLNPGWSQWRKRGQNQPLLLTSKGTPIKLRATEVKVLKPSLFADDSMSNHTAKAIGSIKANTYESLCRKLGNSLANQVRDTDGPLREEGIKLRCLGSIAALTNAGLELLRAIAEGITGMDYSVNELIKNNNVKHKAKIFRSAAKGWTQRNGGCSFLHSEEAFRLAQVATATSDTDLIEGFVDHHLFHGTGAKWIVRSTSNDRIARFGAEAGTNAGTYGYRLHALARLAVQCGVLTASQLPSALQITADDWIDE